MTESHTLLRRPQRSGFTIIEVALAVAIIALGIVAIIGLLPTGLDVIRDAASTTQVANIAEDIITQYQQKALDGSQYDLNPAAGVLPTGVTTTNVTPAESLITYQVRVNVYNGGYPMIDSGAEQTISRVAIDIWYPGSRTNTFLTEVARYVRP